MSESDISALLGGCLPELQKRVDQLSGDHTNSILSYERIVCHLETLLPAIRKQFGASTVAVAKPSSDAWWSALIPNTGIFIEIEKRYFSNEAKRQAKTGDHRADVVLTLHQKDRKLKILLEYKTTSSTVPPKDDALNVAFSEQLIPYLNYEVAAEIKDEADAKDDFICCIAVHLREDQRTPGKAGNAILAVAPNLAYSLKRNSTPPTGDAADSNQHCFFVFHRWPHQKQAVAFTDWLLEQIGQLGQVSAAADEQAPTSRVGTPPKPCVVNVVFGPPGSGKSHWVSVNRPGATVFAPPELHGWYALQAPPSQQVPPPLVIEEWQHFGKAIFGTTYDAAISALKGAWEDLTVVADFGQAREDNHHSPTDPYENIKAFIRKHSQRFPVYRLVPLWIPLRQVHLGIAFMLWIEAVRRELRNTNKAGNFNLAPAAAAQAFVNARTLLINRGLPDHELFDIRIVRSADLAVTAAGVSVGAEKLDAVLQLQLTAAEKKAALEKEIAAAEAGVAATTGNQLLSALMALTKHPVGIAGMEYDNILVRMETRVSDYSNQINEILLACTRAKRRLWLLVDDNWHGGNAASVASMESLHQQYHLIGLDKYIRH